MSLFNKNNNKTDKQKGKEPGGGTKPGTNIPMELDEKTRMDIAENNPWMKSKKRHVDVYHELAMSVAQWRLATFTMMVLVALSVGGNFWLVTNIRVQPYAVEVDEHGYALPVKGFDPTNVDARIVSAQIGSFIINSRARFPDTTTQIIFSENSYKSVASGSNAEKELNNYYVASPPTDAENPVTVRILQIRPLSNASYQAMWVETVQIPDGRNEEFGFIGAFTVSIAPPTEFMRLIDNPLGVYITDYNIVRNY
jgi:type IV secretory pathway TrbF-like protein